MYHTSEYDIKRRRTDMKRINLSAVVTEMRSRFGENLVSLVLFGSHARGEGGPQSDVDLCAVFRDLPRSCWKRNNLVHPVARACEERYGFPHLSIMSLTVEEICSHPPIMLDMVTDAFILFDDGTFEREIENLRERMNELGSRKVYLDDGTWYWDLKPDMKVGEVFAL